MFIKTGRTVGQRRHETVGSGQWRGGTELQEAAEEDGRGVSHAHRQARMTGIRLLHGVQGERSNGVGHVAVGSVLVGHPIWLKSRKAETAGNMPPMPGRVNAQNPEDTPHILREVALSSGKMLTAHRHSIYPRQQ